jgi:hypothetical protein
MLSTMEIFTFAVIAVGLIVPFVFFVRAMMAPDPSP